MCIYIYIYYSIPCRGKKQYNHCATFRSLVARAVSVCAPVGGDVTPHSELEEVCMTCVCVKQIESRIAPTNAVLPTIRFRVYVS